MILKVFLICAAWAACILPTTAAWSSDPALRDLQRHQQQREQQQQELQLRMLQQQRDAQRPGGQPSRALEIDQQQRQQQLHYQQQIAPPSGQPSDDPGTQRGTAQIDDARARQEREQQLRRFDSELNRQKPR